MTGWVARPGRWVVWAVVAFFFVNLAGVVLSVVVDSFGVQWFGTWLPDGFTTHWYAEALPPSPAWGRGRMVNRRCSNAAATDLAGRKPYEHG